jgi:hypothetical protein
VNLVLHGVPAGFAAMALRAISAMMEMCAP